MKTRKPIALLAGLFIAASAFLPAIAAPSESGSWTIRQSSEPDRMQVSFVYGQHSQSSSDWRLSDLKGVDLTQAARHDVHFTIERDAGRIQADGSSASGTAAGSFEFTANPAYDGELRKLGLGGITADHEMAFLLQDVSLQFAREMIGLKITGLTADTLLAMRIHGVEPSYVKDLRAAGARAEDADQLIAFRIHGVNPAMVAAFHTMGKVPDDSQLVALTIHGGTADWVSRFAQLGYGNGAISADQLIAFRIHEVTPDYVAAVEKLGYERPDPDQLIAMKIHGVTPDYIASVKAHGVRDTSLEQLVAMKIHGIN